MPGAQSPKPTRATRLPISDPQANDIAPTPAAANAMVATVLIAKFRMSTAVRLNCWNSRLSWPSGTHAMPSMITLTQSTRSIRVASGEPSARASAGAVHQSNT